MRYRRVKYRYALVLSGGPAGLPAAEWPAGRLGVTIAQPRWRPAADVYETAGGIQVAIELAGVDPDALDALLYEDAIILEGERRVEAADEAGVYHAAEIRQGAFRLELRLPARVDLERIEAQYERGLLRMSFVKVSER